MEIPDVDVSACKIRRTAEYRKEEKGEWGGKDKKQPSLPNPSPETTQRFPCSCKLQSRLLRQTLLGRQIHPGANPVCEQSLQGSGILWWSPPCSMLQKMSLRLGFSTGIKHHLGQRHIWTCSGCIHKKAAREGLACGGTPNWRQNVLWDLVQDLNESPRSPQALLQINMKVVACSLPS